MASVDFKDRCVAALKERWREPVVGIAIGTSSAFLLALLWPFAWPLFSSVAVRLHKTLTGAGVAWPHSGNSLLGLALVSSAILAMKPFGRWIARVVRSWKVGLVSGLVVVFAAVSFLCFFVSTVSTLFHPWLCFGTAAAYMLATVLVSAWCRTDFDPVGVMRRLNIPRDQKQIMRSAVLAEDVFASVLENPNPIAEWNKDWIGRAPFVEGVLRRVIIHQEPVVAITGGFGEGKSSLLNLTKSALRPCPEVVAFVFSSFLPGDEQTLVASLLGSINRAIREVYVVPGLRGDFFKYGRTIAGMIPRMGEPLKDLLRRPSQSEEVTELQGLLRRLPVNVIILLDEIDRLQPDELAVLLKLLRGVTDLPRLHYVCAFNKQALIRAVQGLDERGGNEYLEKFFPVELAIPKIEGEALHSVFRIRLNSLRQEYGSTLTEDVKDLSEQWERLWFVAAKRYFTTLRRLSTYFKNLEAVLRAINEEVSFFDLSVLEAVRQVSPSAFEFIYSNERLFYRRSWGGSSWLERITSDGEEERKVIKGALDTFFSSLDPETRDISIQLLSKIFPNVGTFLQDGGVVLGAPAGDSAEAERLKRIYHPDYFHRYFTYEVPASLYGERELSQFLRSVNNAVGKAGVEEVLRDELETLDKVPLRRSDFFDRLPPACRRLKPGQAELLAYSVAELSSLAPGVWGPGEQGRARDLVFVVADLFVTTGKAQKVLEAIIRNAAADGLAADILSFSIHRENNKIIQDWRNIDEKQLQGAFAERMKSKYSPSSDIPIPKDRGELGAFVAWAGSSEDAQKDLNIYLQSRFKKSQQEVVAFVMWLFPEGVVYQGNPGEFVSRLFLVEELREATTGLEDRVHLTDIQRAALKRFRELCPPSGQGQGGVAGSPGQ